MRIVVLGVVAALPIGALAQSPVPTTPLLRGEVGYGLGYANGKLTMLAPVIAVGTSRAVAASDMGGLLALTGTGTLTIGAPSASVFAAGMGVCYVNEGVGTWTLASTPALKGLASTTVPPLGTGCLTSDGVTIHAGPASVGGPLAGVLALGAGVTVSGGTLAVAGASGPLAGVTALGTNLSIASGTLNAGGGGSTPVATASSLGTVQPDGSTITITGGGVISASAGGGVVYPVSPTYRLTVVSGQCVPATDSPAANTLYWTPCAATRVTLWSGSAWVNRVPGEVSLSLAGVAAGSLYDVFAYDNAGTVALELSAAWVSSTARTDALGTQDGMIVKNADKRRLWLGTIRGSAAGQTADTAGGTTTQVGGKRFVFNHYHRSRHALIVWDSTPYWQTTDTSWHGYNAATGLGNCVEWVQGDAAAPVVAYATATGYSQDNTGATGQVGIGINTRTAPSGFRAGSSAVAGRINVPIAASFTYPVAQSSYVNPNLPTLGYNFACQLEKAGGAGNLGGPGATYFNGGFGGDGGQSGMTMILN